MSIPRQKSNVHFLPQQKHGEKREAVTLFPIHAPPTTPPQSKFTDRDSKHSTSNQAAM